MRAALVLAALLSAAPARAGFEGVVGPTRMPYASAIALVGHIARLLGRRLAGDDAEPPGEDRC